jgi:hypothetical protein
MVADAESVILLYVAWGGALLVAFLLFIEGYLEEDHPIKSSPLRLTSLRGVGGKRWSDLLAPPVLSKAWGCMVGLWVALPFREGLGWKEFVEKLFIGTVCAAG